MMEENSLSRITVFLILILVVVLLIAPSRSGASERFALVIGNANYDVLPNASAARNDTTVVASALSEAGYNVFGGGPHQDLSAEQLRAIVTQFSVEVAQAHGAMIYFSGRGAFLNGAMHLLGTNVGTTPSKSDGVDIQDALRILDRAGVTVKIMIVDVAHSPGTIVTQSGATAAFSASEANSAYRSLAGTLGGRQTPRGAFISFSARPGQLSMTALDGVSHYAAALAEVSKFPGSRLRDSFIAIRNIVLKRTNGAQTPWELSSLRRRFIFSE